MHQITFSSIQLDIQKMKCRKEEFELEASIWFQKAQNKFLGGDRIALLEKINELGSINSAAKAVGISYKTAWHLSQYG